MSFKKIVDTSFKKQKSGSKRVCDFSIISFWKELSCFIKFKESMFFVEQKYEL